MTNFVKQGVSIKGTLIQKPDGKMQVHMRGVSPYQGDIHKYLSNITMFPTAKAVTNKDGSIRHYELGTLTGYHKGVKAMADMSNKRVEYTVLQQYHTFPVKEDNNTGQTAAPTQAAPIQPQVGIPAAPVQAPVAQAAPIQAPVNVVAPQPEVTSNVIGTADQSEVPFDLKQVNMNKYIPGTKEWIDLVCAMIRRSSVKWGPRYQTINRNKLDRGKYKCELCDHIGPLNTVQVDHTVPVTPVTGFDNFDAYMRRLCCTAEEMKLLCKECHKKKSKAENALRAENRKKLKINN